MKDTCDVSGTECPKSVTQCISEALAARDKEWVEWIEKFISYSEDGRKESIGILWNEWQSRRKEIGI